MMWINVLSKYRVCPLCCYNLNPKPFIYTEQSEGWELMRFFVNTNTIK